MTSDWEYDRDGALRFVGAAAEHLAYFASLPPFAAENSPPGKRLFNMPALAERLTGGPIGDLARRVLGDTARPVRALAFDKRADCNWALDWHQDRTIAVRRRLSIPGFGPWGRKIGQLHVAPPQSILERMLTVRIHLDEVRADDAPLLVAPGSHRLGRIAEHDIPRVVAKLGARSCLAAPGDVWVYATPILHASRLAQGNGRRRVLQADYSADPLPGGLEWTGVG
ncbi:phytanoyl-CoA dioxygenase family protein [Sphingomonas mesophila]|uniref:phytanoyl-CoA dioxygenase family protein n=1 Tax=Sphingomonas mesophila TaxID=2303576 RepID=UPI000E590FA0|nr:phytanoyl-CoA dioxygenase family protein [Sphingomonas mesophila]